MSANPLFLKALAKLDQWRERYNPFKGLTMRKLAELLEEGDRGLFINLQWLLRKMERRNPTIRACKLRMGSELKKLQWSIKIPSDLPKGYTEAQALKQQEFLRARYEAIDNLTEANAFLVGAELKGFAHVEKHYGSDGYPAHLEPVPQWHFWKDGFYAPWRFDEKANGNAHQGEPIRPENFLIHEVEDPWYEIAMISALREVLGSRDFEAFVKDYGIPWFFIVGPAGMDDPKAESFQSVADDVVGDGRGVLPHGSDVKGPPAGSGSSQVNIFTEYLNEQRKSIVLAATGGLLTMLTESGSGTLAGGAHQEAWENIVGGAAQSVTEVFQEQFDKPLLQEAFPNQPILCYYELAYPEAPENRKDIVGDIKTLKDAGYAVTREMVAEKTGFEFDEVVDPPLVTPPALPVPAVTPPPIKNRTASSPDTLRLAENALANVLDVGTDYLLPVEAPLLRLIALAESDTATLADFTAFAEELQRTFPELIAELDMTALADALEPALGTAAVLGVREAMRERAAATKG